jgi:alpha-galactosidase
VFDVVAEVTADPARMRLLAEGWQSWSPTLIHTVGEVSPRPADARVRDHFFRPSGPDLPASWSWQADGGLMAVETGHGSVHIFGPAGPKRIPIVRARLEGSTLVVASDGSVVHQELDGPLEDALTTWASSWNVIALSSRPAPTG